MASASTESEKLLDSQPADAEPETADAEPETARASSSSSPGRRSRRQVLLAASVVGVLAVTACLVTYWCNGSKGGEGIDLGGDHNDDPLEAITSKFLEKLWPSKARPECRNRLDRLAAIHAGAVKLKPGGTHDPDFPPNMDSLGDAGICGDSAQGIQEDCTKYNHWVSMQKVANRYYKVFSVFKPGGVQYHDIGQGRLGTCYFLGALASIAHSAPHLIEEMFVRRELWKDNIFTTKWLIDEQETLIEVDGMIPASDDNIAYFVQPSSTGEFWPAILEKAWAKIHTSFAAIEGGYWPMPVMAITRAPVRSSYHKVGWKAHLRHLLRIFRYVNQGTLWDQMVDATSQHHPMASSTGGKDSRAPRYGLARAHAYSVFRAYESPDYGKVVEVFNPWNSDNYNGKIPNPDKKDGLFTMTFDEYWDAFSVTYFAEVSPHYRSTAARVQHGQESKWSHHNFEVKSIAPGKSFFVSLTWPAHRLVEPCPMLNPDTTLQVVKGDEHGNPTSEVFNGMRDGKVVNAKSAEVTSGPGNYHILTNAQFDITNFVDDLYLSVYAPEEVKIAEVGSIADGDRFDYEPWGRCVAHWVNGELWMRSEAIHSTDGAKIFKTLEGSGADLVDGKVVEVQWENSHQVKAHMVNDDKIRIDNRGHVSFFTRANPEPIPGSKTWWTCQHDNMYLCGDACCCDRSKWIAEDQVCRPI